MYKSIISTRKAQRLW